MLLLTRLAALIAILTLASACSTSGASPAAPSASAGATGSPSASTSGQSQAPASQTIEVKLTDALKIEPAEMSVRAGQPVKFVVTNSGATDHEFYLGDAAAQDEHDKEMMSMGGMMHDDPNGIALKAGETKELTYTFATAGPFLAGCHVNQHYAAGMKASITVTE